MTDEAAVMLILANCDGLSLCSAFVLSFYLFFSLATIFSFFHCQHKDWIVWYVAYWMETGIAGLCKAQGQTEAALGKFHRECHRESPLSIEFIAMLSTVGRLSRGDWFPYMGPVLRLLSFFDEDKGLGFRVQD